MKNNTGGIVESSDRGGSQFSDDTGVGIAITVVQDVWTDISDSSVDIHYGTFSANEKVRLNDEANGELIWTGVRDRGRVLVSAERDRHRYFI